MQVDRRFEGANDEQQTYTPLARASVWIDPVEQRNVSTSYVERGQEGRRKNVASHSTHSIHPDKSAHPTPSTSVPARASAYPAHSLSVRHRASHTYMRPASQQDADFADMPTLPPDGERQARPISSLHSEARIPLRSRLHPESTASRRKNASLSPQRAIDELDTLPPISSTSSISSIPPVTPVPSVERIEQAIDEIDTILPISPSIDELDTLPLPLKSSRKSEEHTNHQTNVHRTASLHENEVDIDEIDTLAPGTVTVLPPEPVQLPSEYARKQVTIVDSRPSVPAVVQAARVERIRQTERLGRDVPWTTGAAERSEFARLIASRAQARQGKPLGELVLTPLSEARWWLLYPGRMEFILWISGALILLGVTCTLLFATLASTGLIRMTTTNAAIGTQRITARSTTCTPSTAHCHNGSKGATVVSSSTSKHHSPSTSGATQATSVPATAPVSSKTPGTSSNAPVGGSAGTSTPVSQTPIAASPTVSISPTVEPTRTTPTPTPTKTVTPAPTSGITPTVSTTPPAKKPTTTTSHHTDSQTLALTNALDGSTPSQSGMTNTWMWLVLIGYAFSMVMLGLAALLYRRKRRV